MKMHFFIALLLTQSVFVYGEVELPQCGSRHHCYALLNKIKNFSREEREQFTDNMKKSGLEFAKESLNVVFATLKDVLTQADNNDAASSEDAKNSKRDDFVDFVNQYAMKSFDCRNGIEWAKQKKDETGDKMLFAVKEFDCGDMLAKALHDDTFVYPKNVLEWLENFDSEEDDENEAYIEKARQLFNTIKSMVLKWQESVDGSQIKLMRLKRTIPKDKGEYQFLRELVAKPIGDFEKLAEKIDELLVTIGVGFGMCDALEQQANDGPLNAILLLATIQVVADGGKEIAALVEQASDSMTNTINTFENYDF